MLKPQDSLLALKYWSIAQSDQPRPSVRELSESIGVSASEVSKGTQRLLLAQLVVSRNSIAVVSGNLLEWLSYGLRYAYPQESIGYGRGLPTAWSCPLVKTEMVAPEPAWVWSTPGGAVEGALIKPFHDSVPLAASNDSYLYQALSLSEAIRGGKPRELAIARDALAVLLKGGV